MLVADPSVDLLRGLQPFPPVNAQDRRLRNRITQCEFPPPSPTLCLVALRPIHHLQRSVVVVPGDELTASIE